MLALKSRYDEVGLGNHQGEKNRELSAEGVKKCGQILESGS